MTFYLALLVAFMLAATYYVCHVIDAFDDINIDIDDKDMWQ